MKLKELKQIVDHAITQFKGEEAEVVISMAEPGIPHAPMVKVKTANQGFDWTMGYFLIHPDKPLMRKPTK